MTGPVVEHPTGSDGPDDQDGRDDRGRPASGLAPVLVLRPRPARSAIPVDLLDPDGDRPA